MHFPSGLERMADLLFWRAALFNPKGIASGQPKVARDELPWVNRATILNRDAVAATRSGSGHNTKVVLHPAGQPWALSRNSVGIRCSATLLKN